jgi:hypothetical protein
VNRYNTPSIISLLVTYIADHPEVNNEAKIKVQPPAGAGGTNGKDKEVSGLAGKETRVAEEKNIPEATVSPPSLASLASSSKRGTREPVAAEKEKEKETPDPVINNDVHYLLPFGQGEVVVPVFGAEVSSMVAHALISKQYVAMVRGSEDQEFSFEGKTPPSAPSSDFMLPSPSSLSLLSLFFLLSTLSLFSLFLPSPFSPSSPSYPSYLASWLPVPISTLLNSPKAPPDQGPKSTRRWRDEGS